MIRLKEIFRNRIFSTRTTPFLLGLLVQPFLYFSVFSTGIVLAATCGPGPGTCANSQTCSCDTTCSQVQKDLNGGVCPAGDSSTSCSCQRPGGSCNRPGVPVDCPAGTTRTDNIVSSVCMGFCSLGTAQVNTGVCCDWQEEPPSGCVTTCVHNYITGNDRCRTDCSNPGGPWCRTSITNTYSCCTAGPAPTLSSPANASIFAGPSGAASVDFTWVAPTDWGSGGGSSTPSYSLCVGTNSSDPCTGGTTYTNTGTTSVTKTASVPAGQKYWSVKATNACGSTSVNSTVRSVCIEGNTLPTDNGVGNAYYSQWSACNANHIRTRTCTEDCGTDNCTAAAAAGLLQENCEGEIRGTIFDATLLSSCPSFDPNTGYLVGVDRTLTANSRVFGMADQSSTAPHPWATITNPQTDSSGNYAVRVYAPATYTYDFTSLRDMYVVSAGPKLTCTGTNAVVPTNSVNCGTQPCSTVNNMSFGFDRYWGGWWQVEGAGVHGETGIKSSIPMGLLSEQSLILADANGRRGVASYGMETVNMLGVNPNAKVSNNLWKALSGYEGVIYDYAYFNQQFKKYATTTWDGTSGISYDDNGAGYQIFKVAGPVANFSYNPTGTQKVIFLINGDVSINSNIVVPNGAFMAVIASGDISFGTSVTQSDGWYLGNNIQIRCLDANSDAVCDRTDVQFVGNGSFVAWKGIYLTRDRDGDNNIAAPSSKFNYRVDLYNNAPEPMKIVTKKYKPFVP